MDTQGFVKAVPVRLPHGANHLVPLETEMILFGADRLIRFDCALMNGFPSAD